MSIAQKFGNGAKGNFYVFLARFGVCFAQQIEIHIRQSPFVARGVVVHVGVAVLTRLNSRIGTRLGSIVGQLMM